MSSKPTENEELNALIDDLCFTDLQKRLVGSARVALDSQINRSRTISEIYSINSLERIANRIITSNEQLSASNEKFSKAANWLTAGLLILAFIQIVVQIIPLITKS